MKEINIDQLKPVPTPPDRCELARVCRKLATEGSVGDSFVSDKQTSRIREVAWRVGMKVIIRAEGYMDGPGQRKRYRVWRSDGLSESDLNAVIQSRAQNPDFKAPAKPCVPPSPGSKYPRRKKTGRPGASVNKKDALKGLL